MLAGFYPHRGVLPGACGTPNKGNAHGAVDIFRKRWARVSSGPAPGPTHKRLCAGLARSVGRATNTASKIFL